MRQLSAAVAIAVAVISGPALAAPNLVANGNFEAGNTGFNSDYSYAPAVNTLAGEYTVRTDPFPWNPFFISAGDHTSGSGNMFVGNGAAQPDTVWSQTITVAPNTDYFFEAFVMNVCCNATFGHGDQPVSPAILSFYADGGFLATGNTNSLGVWEGLGTTWHSGNSQTSVVLSLVNSNLVADGNDFAVDDIFLGTESTIRVPEPASLALLGTGLLALAAGRRRRR